MSEQDTDQCVLCVAEMLVNGDRQRDYGHPYDNCANIAAGWEVILGGSVSPEQVALCMAWLKIARETNTPKRDNRVDLAGYAKVLDMVVEERNRREGKDVNG